MLLGSRVLRGSSLIVKLFVCFLRTTESQRIWADRSLKRRAGGHHLRLRGHRAPSTDPCGHHVAAQAWPHWLDRQETPQPRCVVDPQEVSGCGGSAWYRQLRYIGIGDWGVGSDEWGQRKIGMLESSLVTQASTLRIQKARPLWPWLHQNFKDNQRGTLRPTRRGTKAPRPRCCG